MYMSIFFKAKMSSFKISRKRLRLRHQLVRAGLLGGLRHGAADGLRGGSEAALRRHGGLGWRTGAEVRAG